MYPNHLGGREKIRAAAKLDVDLAQAGFTDGRDYGTSAIERGEGPIGGGRVGRGEATAPGIISVRSNIERDGRRRRTGALHGQHRGGRCFRTGVGGDERVVAIRDIRRNNDVELKLTGPNESRELN
jgi:hypothetical protein